MKKKKITKRQAKERYGIITTGVNSNYSYYLLKNGDVIDNDGDIRYMELKENEQRVYVLDASRVNNRTTEKFIMKKAEELGTVYSLQGFQDAINNNELYLDNSYIYISNK